MKGFTEVWTGHPELLGQAIAPWITTPSEKIKTSLENGEIVLHIHNSMINWDHFTESGEYVPVYANVKRSQRSVGEQFIGGMSADDFKGTFS